MSSNIFLKNITLNNLLKYTEYTYSVQDIGSNYKIALINSSGQFTTNDGSHNIPLYIIFCPNDLSCSDFDHVIDGRDLYDVDTDPNELIAHLNFTTHPIDLPQLASSQEILQICVDCTEGHKLNIVSPELDALGPNTNKFEIIVEALSLKPNTSYAYEILPTDANWPLYIDNISGVVHTTDYPAGSYKDLKTEIKLSAHFAPSSGTNHGNMPYSIQEGINNDILISSFSVVVYPINHPEHKAVSNQIKLSCSDCFYRPTIHIVSSVQEDTNNTAFDLVTNISHLLPNLNYSYSYNIIDSNWPIILNNTSGNLITNHQNNQIINNSLIFCTDATCPSGTENIIPATTQDQNEDKYAKLLFTINTTESCYGSHTSDPYVIETNIPDPPAPILPTMSIQITSEDRCNI